MLANLRVGLHPLGEFPSFFPDLHGRALHQAVGRVPGKSLFNQGQEQALGEDQSMGEVKVQASEKIPHFA